MSKRAFFIIRLNDHIQYLKKIEATLDGKGDFHGTDHHECKLGQWLYGEGAEEMLALQQNSEAKEVFDSLFEPHENFHTVSKQALELIDDNQSAQQAMTEMYKLSHVITKKLLALDVLK
jgi:hypothetical protein